MSDILSNAIRLAVGKKIQNKMASGEIERPAYKKGGKIKKSCSKTKKVSLKNGHK